MFAENNNVLILTDRDKAEYDYLCQVRGEASVVYASQHLAGKRKPYVSNIAKWLKVEIPDNLHIGVPVATPEQVQYYLDEIKKLLGSTIEP